MILFDVNVLIHAVRKDSPRHAAGLSLVADALEGSEPVAWHPFLGAAVIRIATNKRIFLNAVSLRDCLSFIAAFRTGPVTVEIGESDSFWLTFERLLLKYQVVGPEVSDAYLAALAIDSGATLISSDREFGKYVELDWRHF